MSRRTKMWIGVVVGIATVVGGSGSAAAASLRIDPAGAIRMVSLGKITITAGSTTMACNITLTGTLSNALLNKVAGTQVGSITRFDWETCTGGEIERVSGTPWPLKYQSITGTLPERVTAITLTIERFDFGLSVFGGFARCRYSGNSAFTMGVTGSNPYTSGLIPSNRTGLRLVEGFACPEPLTMTGTFRLEPTQRITRL